jgi:hypothetical protein
MSCLEITKMPPFVETQWGGRSDKGHGHDESKGREASWNYPASDRKKAETSEGRGSFEGEHSTDSPDCKEVSN